MFPVKSLFKVALPDNQDSIRKAVDTWGNPLPVSQRHEIKSGDIGVVLGGVHAAQFWECNRCKRLRGDPRTRKHFRSVLIDGFPAVLPVCEMRPVVDCSVKST